MLPPTGRYSTSPCKASKEYIFYRTRTVIIQGRELTGHPDRHIFGEDSQSLAPKKLGRSLYSGRPVPSLCEWRAIQSQFIWCAGLSCLFRSSTNQLHKRDRPTRPEGPDHRSTPRNVAWHLFFRPLGGKSLCQYSARPSFSIFLSRAPPIRCDCV
jgi:hypothetical protein